MVDWPLPNFVNFATNLYSIIKLLFPFRIYVISAAGKESAKRGFETENETHSEINTKIYLIL